MDETIDDNKITDNENNLQLEYKFNFIDRPWDDRTINSKVGIVILLTTIFVATIACVINLFVLHYRNFNCVANSTELTCYRVKLKEYPFVARIHSMSSKQLLCVGAVVSSFSVLASGICVQSGPTLVFIGSHTESRCKRGFVVDIVDFINHDGIVSKRLVLLSSEEDMTGCAIPIRIGTTLNWNSKVDIIGRSSNVGWSLTRQHVSLTNETSKIPYKNLNMEIMVCTKDLARCPVKAGDLLIQRGFLYGLATTSVQFNRNAVACFANLTVVKNDLEILGINFEKTSRRKNKVQYKQM